MQGRKTTYENYEEDEDDENDEDDKGKEYGQKHETNPEEASAKKVM